HGNVQKHSLSESMRLLTAEQTKRLSTYNHKGSKTTLERLMIATITKITERIYPNCFNANFVTVMG
ncbi:MAG: hypothetical protein ACK521_03725, partial [bacterium]